MFKWLRKEKKKRVLLIGCSYRIEDIVCFPGEKNNYEARKLESDEKLIDVTRKYKPDIILLDVQLSYFSGFEAIELLKQDEILKNIPVIGLADNPKIENATQYENADFKAFISDYSADSVHETMLAALGGHWGTLKKHPFDHMTREQIELEIQREIEKQKLREERRKTYNKCFKLNNEQLERVRDLYLKGFSARHIAETTGFLDGSRNRVLLEIFKMNLRRNRQ